MEQENNKNEADTKAEDLAKSESSEKKSPNLLKAKSDIAKSVAKNFLKTRKANVTSEVQRKRPKKKTMSISEGNKAAENNVKKLDPVEKDQQKDATTSTEYVEKSQQIQKNEENTCASDSKEKITKSNDDPKKQRNGVGPGLSNKDKKNEEKREGKKKRKRNENKERHSNPVNNNMNDEKREGKGKKQEIKKKEKIDGLIFMCNARTKPDCFRYRVMGVRFSVHSDCFPLAENIFKKAIKENYDEKNKFKTELTARQVRKLTELFRPVPVHSTALPFHSPSRAAARITEHPEKREAHDRPREARPSSHREASVRDPYSNISARNYAGFPHERNQRVGYGEVAYNKREDGHRDLYLSEKEYRTYGLLGERRNLTPQHHITPTLTSYLGDYREPPLRQPDTAYRESVPLQRDVVRSDPLRLTEREYRTYDLGATREMQPTVSAATANTSGVVASILDSYIADPYYGRYSGDPLVDAYLSRPREAHLIETDHLRRIESNQAERLYSQYPSDVLVDHNRMQRHRDVNPASASTSVSSRYSFGGASLPYR
ncbi:hypothetical protein GOBAR_AA03517 [Gossypium barbadense]|uniref:DCD domain-containing protein n=1 Tax=Gossypium barbadense TaxID=3634 RepID=A0A2P5YN95_GOSBA|nr:hypothetical protein GOBAR_AA03517 [Gossypium barbadense]